MVGRSNNRQQNWTSFMDAPYRKIGNKIGRHLRTAPNGNMTIPNRGVGLNWKDKRINWTSFMDGPL